AERQIIPYYGGKREYDQLIAALRQAPFVDALPDPLPEPPPSPLGTPPAQPARRSLWLRLGVTAALVLIVAVALAALVNSGSPPAPAAPPTQTAAPPTSTATQTATVAATATDDPTEPPDSTVAAASPTNGPVSAGGELVAALIYEGENALTFLMVEAGDPRGITLILSADEAYPLVASFDVLRLMSEPLPAGTCLRFERANGSLPPLPTACNERFPVRLNDSDVFWWSDASVSARAIRVEFTRAVAGGGSQVLQQVCSPTPPRCDLVEFHE
ncbi:MAG: hypothetical protein GYB67_17785, partial [Chloroflexi bacterium]|nr:hypothetical protein [Chloroflexota bacterium]